MKKYMLFGGWEYYPAGGWADFLGDYDTLEEAVQGVQDLNGEWFGIVDSESKEYVARATKKENEYCEDKIRYFVRSKEGALDQEVSDLLSLQS